MIDGGEKRICRLSFECQSSHVIERRSKCKLDECEKDRSDGLEGFPCRTVDQDKALLIDHY